MKAVLIIVFAAGLLAMRGQRSVSDTTGPAQGAAGASGCQDDCSALSHVTCISGIPACDPSAQRCVCRQDCYSDPGKCGKNAHCRSVCSPDGTCVCRGPCGMEGQIGYFKSCCPGLSELGYYQDATSCTKPVAGRLFVCASCGNKICGRGENHCNCPQDCPSSQR